MSAIKLLEDLQAEFNYALGATEAARMSGTMPEKALAEQSAVKLRYWLSRINALPKSGGWRPIGTAPKDGNTVLVGRDMGEPWGFIYGAGFYFETHGIAGWICRGLREPPGELGLGAPTHWMPLPLPPPPQKEKK